MIQLNNQIIYFISKLSWKASKFFFFVIPTNILRLEFTADYNNTSVLKCYDEWNII